MFATPPLNHQIHVLDASLTSFDMAAVSTKARKQRRLLTKTKHYPSSTWVVFRFALVLPRGRFAISLLGNPRFSQSFLHGETCVSPTPFLFDSTREHSKKAPFKAPLFCCAPAWNRTTNNGLEVRSYIHLTTGAYPHSIKTRWMGQLVIFLAFLLFQTAHTYHQSL